MLVRAVLLVLLALAGSSPAWATGPITYPPGGSGSGSAGFDAITSGTNTTATMVVGTGGSLATSGSGTIVATTAAALTTDPAACTGNNWVKDFNAAGTLVCTQPDFTNISGSVTDAQVPDTITLTNITQIGTRPHSSLTGLTSGDDHTQYALLAGRSGGQTLIGGTAASDKLVLQSTSNGTKGSIDLDELTTRIFPSFPASTASTTAWRLLDFSPTTTLSNAGGAQKIYGLGFGGTYSVAGSAGTNLVGVLYDPTIDLTDTTNPLIVYQANGIRCNPTFTSSTASGPLYQDCMSDLTLISYSGTTNVSSTRNPFNPYSINSQMVIRTTNSGSLAIPKTAAVHFIPTFGTQTNGSTLTLDRLHAVNAATPVCDYDGAHGGLCRNGTTNTTGNVVVTDYAGMDIDFGAAVGTGMAITNAYGMVLRSFGKATNNYTVWSDSTSAQLAHAGAARFGATGDPSTTSLAGIATKVDDQGSLIVKGGSDLGSSVTTDIASGQTAIVNIAPAVNVTGGTGDITGMLIAPTTTTSGTSSVNETITGIEFSPTATHSGTTGGVIPTVTGLRVAGTSTTSGTAGNSFLTAAIMKHSRTYTSAVASENVVAVTTITDTPTINSSATSGTSTANNNTSVLHNPTFNQSGNGGSMTFNIDYGLNQTGTYTAGTGGTTTVTARKGLNYPEVTTSGAGTVAVTNNIAVDVGTLTLGTTERTALKSNIGANAVAYFLHDTGGAQMSTVGKFTTYNNVAADTSHSGVPLTGWSVSATAQTANIAAANLIASATAGRYRMCGYVAVTTQATTTSTVPNVAITCTDPTDSVAKTVEITGAITAVAANPTTAVAHSGCGICDAKASTAIKYSTTDYASTGATPMAYKVYVTLEVM